MVSSRHYAKRADPLSLPPGFEPGITQSSTVAPTDGLAVDTGASSITQSPTGLLVTPTPMPTEPASTSPPPPTSTPTPSPAAATSGPIPMSTVIGACVGALIGAVALIILGLWFYRRYAKSLKQHGRSRRVLGTPRNVNAEQGRRRSHLEPWNKLEEGDDKWEGMYQTKEVDSVAPMEKLTMFKKSTPSVRTAYTTKSSDEPVTFDAHSFVQYHPNLARDLASEDKLPDLPIARQFLGRVDTGPAISWDGETLGENSYIDGRGTISPTPNKAIPTPVATKSQSHHWESAEVIQYVESEQASSNIASQDPFENDHSEQRRSISNPFFSAQGSASIRRPRSNSNRSARSRSVSVHSRSSSISTMKPKAEEPPIPKVDKGKGRAIEPDDNPFADGAVPSLSRPFASHHTSGSLSSASSNDRALQSLIAALDISAEEAQERLRIASMQPSVISTASYTTTSGEEDVTGSFPLPPATEGMIKFR